MVSVISPAGGTSPGGGPIVSRAVGPGGAWIGRSTACEILVDDPQRHVSLRHCRIDSADGGFWITDVSTNGTFLNDAAAPLPKGERQALAAGDRLRIGSFLITIDAPAPDVIAPGPSLVASFADPPPSPLLDPAWALPAGPSGQMAPPPGVPPHDGTADSLGALLADLLPGHAPSAPSAGTGAAGTGAAGTGAAGTGLGIAPASAGGGASPGIPFGTPFGSPFGPPFGTDPGAGLPMFAPPPPTPTDQSLLHEADPFSLLGPPSPSAPNVTTPLQAEPPAAEPDRTPSWEVPAPPPFTAPLAASAFPAARPEERDLPTANAVTIATTLETTALPLGQTATMAPPPAGPMAASDANPARPTASATPIDPIAAALDPTATAVDELVSALASEIVRQPPSALAPRAQDVEVYAPDRAGSAATRALAAFWCGLGIMPKGLDPASLATVMMDLGAALREATDGFAAMTAAASQSGSNQSAANQSGSNQSGANQQDPGQPGPAQPGPFANGHADLRRLIEDRDASAPRLDELVRAVFAAAAEREDFQAAGVRTALHRALRSMTASAVRTRFGALLRGRREATRRAELIDLMFKMEAELIELAETHFRRELADAMHARIGRRIPFGGPRR